MTTAYSIPAEVDRVERLARGVGVVGLVACAIGWAMTPSQFYRSYLIAFLFWLGVGLGCLSIVMIHHLSGGGWGLGIRRLLEAGTRTLFFAGVLFLPVLIGMKDLYIWASPETHGADKALVELLERKSLYLNVPFFVGRAVFYFVVWALLVHFLNKWSLARDTAPSDRADARLRGLAGGGMVLMVFTVTFAAIDWGMSLRPQWFSTIYGLLFFVGQVLSAFALMIVALSLLGKEKPLSDLISTTSVHDLGKFMLAFVMIWAYVALSQFLIVWSGNLPEEIPWYMDRIHGGWGVLALFLVVFHFALPFLLLLSRGLKRNIRLLGMVAAGMLVVRFLDLFWLIAPELYPGGLAVHLLDVAAVLGLGGAWLALFTWQLKGRSLVPIGDPEVREYLAARG